MIEGAGIKLVWAEASNYRHGTSMENGLDLSVTQTHYNWYIKQGKMSQAGALMAVLTGALWPVDRLGSEDPHN
eukprot:6769305-Karenia_brevis.AAC.1